LQTNQTIPTKLNMKTIITKSYFSTDLRLLLDQWTSIFTTPVDRKRKLNWGSNGTLLIIIKKSSATEYLSSWYNILIYTFYKISELIQWCSPMQPHRHTKKLEPSNSPAKKEKKWICIFEHNVKIKRNCLSGWVWAYKSWYTYLTFQKHNNRAMGMFIF